ncbi:hypothetical protein E4U43_007244 [Claviceps pusilla]|uniref:ATP-grasp domain-containing protein n=1 Tax=Claviceps pusilla TaxID=123648 RepID=A0A9P7T0Q2_9HYPO|nr:hypothetical protein E4U43_007244 [Claviceps pusilla]
MKICIFQSSYEGTDSPLQQLDNCPSQPGLFTSQHEFECRWIHKDKAEQEIDDAVAEGFDFYFNFLWGTLDDAVAGVSASRYIESLGLPFCGLRSLERSRNKNDFLNAARLRGAPLVPGVEQFPLFVKPANGCASQLIDEKSVCRNQEELDRALRRINEALYEPRVRRATALGIENPIEYARSFDTVGRDSNDIVVQEYIEGKDYGCVVVQMGGSCVALTPYVYRMKRLPQEEQFLTFDLKFDDETHPELLQKKDDAVLFERLQKAAMEAFVVSGCKDNNTGCDVDLRVTSNGQVFVIEVNPQPAQFIPRGTDQDWPIIHSFPGGHAAVINVFIANHMLRYPEQWGSQERVASYYDAVAPTYDEYVRTGDVTVDASLAKLVDKFDYSGTILDLGCGTGCFGRIMGQSPKFSQQQTSPCEGSYHLLGCDISPGMLDICRKTGHYHSTHLDSIEAMLTNLTQSIDHMVSSSALHLLRPEIFSLVVALMFVHANKSITLSVDEITNAYKANLARLGIKMFPSFNHLAGMEMFGEPKGWRLVSRERVFSWVSPKTGDRIYTTYFRFERAQDASRDIMFRSAELLKLN